MKSLFEYTLSPSVRAFSTTRVSPFDTELSDGLQRNSNYAAFNVHTIVEIMKHTLRKIENGCVKSWAFKKHI